MKRKSAFTWKIYVPIVFRSFFSHFDVARCGRTKNIIFDAWHPDENLTRSPGLGETALRFDAVRSHKIEEDANTARFSLHSPLFCGLANVNDASGQLYRRRFRFVRNIKWLDTGWRSASACAPDIRLETSSCTSNRTMIDGKSALNTERKHK